jgi:ubiquinone biosynthesis protein
LASCQPWVRRGVRFWGGCAPIGATYAVALLRARREDRDETLEALHKRCAPRALALVSALGGGYVKIGQVLANRADVLPEPYVRALGTLHDSAPQRPWPAMARRLAAEAPALFAVLGEVDPIALGAASTGQAHMATLTNGTLVVLKMQYPGSSSKFGTDFANAARLVGAVLPALKPMVLEARRRFMLEFDYVREAEDMCAVRAGTRSRRVFVPMPYTKLTSTTVLVMEYVPGTAGCSPQHPRARHTERHPRP